MRRKTLVLAALTAVFAVSVAAQTAHFGAIESVVAPGCTSECFGVAVDGTGNVYIADTYANRILMETPTVGGYTQSVVAIGLNKPYGVAVDGQGNVYVADSFNFQIVKETLSAGSYTPSVVVSGLSGTPFEVASDASGNVYFADNGTVYKETLSGGVYTQSVVANAANNGLSEPWEVAVDQSGNVYISDTGNERVLKETLLSGAYVQTVVASGLNFPTGVAVDGSGNVYITNTYSNQILKETPSAGSYTQSTVATGLLSFPYEIAVDSSGSLYIANPQAYDVLKETFTGVNFGAINVGSTNQALTLNFVFDNAGSIGAPIVSTQGAANLDFVDAGTGSCTTNGTHLTYSIGETCQMDVTFTPKYPGARYGAVVLTDNAGNEIATAYVQGIGVGPQLQFLPGTLNTLGSGFDYPWSVAVDGSGNVFVADTDHSAVKEILAAGGYGTVVTLGSGFDYPQGVAVDGGGNVFVADTSGSAVKEIVAAGGFSTIKVLGSGFIGPTSVAVDGSGNVFVADQFVGVKEILAAGGYTTVKTLGSGFVLPVGVAVDKDDNVFVADAGNSTVNEILAEGGYTQIETIGSGFDGPENLALDAAGNVYVADAWNQEVKEILAAGGYTTVKTLVGSRGFYLFGVALDQAGNVYIASTYNNQIIKADFADPPSLKFATTVYGTTSLDSPQGVTVGNNGNAALNFSGISYPPSFPESSAGINDCSTTNSLLTDENCTLTIDFTPVAVGTLSGSLVLTDNMPGNATQSLALSGTGTQATPVITWAAPAAITYGTALSAPQLDATASVPGTFSYSPAAGTVLGAGPQTLSTTFTPTDASDYKTATATVTLTVNQATPTIAWATPATIVDGTALSATQLDATASVPGTFAYSPALGATPPVGNDTLSVTFAPTDNVDYASATATVILTVNPLPNPVPFIGNMTPAIADAGGAAFTITVNGANFLPNSTVYWGTSALVTQYVSASRLTATVTAADIATPGATAINVQTPAPGGGTSDILQFEVDSPAATATAPTVPSTVVSITAGSTASYSISFPAAVTSATATCLNLPAGAICSYSSATKVLTISTASTTPAGTYQVTVVFSETVASTASAGIFLPFLLLPLFFLRRKPTSRGIWPAACLGLILLATTAFSIGCGGSSSSTSSQSTQSVTSSGVVALTVQ